MFHSKRSYWRKLDNAAKLFPATSNKKDTRVFRFYCIMKEDVKEETMADYEDHFDDANPWNRVTEYMEKNTILPVKVEGVVNGGVIAMVEGLRGF